MVHWQSPGGVLRWWRTAVAKLSQRAFADRLGVARTAVTNWERGTRELSIEPAAVDEALEAGGVLAGLLWAFGAREGIEPARVWTNVFRGPSSEVWMWIRSPAAEVKVDAEWGLYAFDRNFVLPPNGVFVTVGASVDDSPVVVVLSEPGWVEFGRGALPEAIEGAIVVDAVEMMRPSSATGEVFNDLLSSNLTAMIEGGNHRVGRLDEGRLRPVTSFLRDLDRSGPPRPTPGVALGEGLDEQERERFARLRRARGLSLAETRTLLERQVGVVVGKDTLRRFELGTGEPHDPLLPAALDHVLGGNGHLAMTAIRSGDGSGAVTFPPYWAAPVWMHFERSERASADRLDPGGAARDGKVAELLWGGWHRGVEGRLPCTVICHGSPRALRVVAEPDVRWTAGVGRRAGAVPIDRGWVPTSVDTTREAISEYREVLLDAVRRQRRSGPETDR